MAQDTPPSSEHEIRRKILSTVLREDLRDEDTFVIEELGIGYGRSRIDIAVLNGKFIGYEIKSARDSLRRLPQQVTTFGAAFDEIVIVAATKHISSVLENVPRWWGIVEYSETAESTCSKMIRESKPNPSPNNAVLGELLWKDEALSALKQKGRKPDPRTRRGELIQALTEIVSRRELLSIVRCCLKSRAEWRSS